MLGRLWSEYGDLCFQGGGVAAAAAGSYAASRFLKPAPVKHDRLESTRHLKDDADLARLVLEFEPLKREGDWAEMVAAVDGSMELAARYEESSAPLLLHELNRRVQHATRVAEGMARAARSSADDGVLEACVNVTEEHLPALVEALEAVLERGMMKY